MEGPDTILVHPEEYELALDAGWDKKDILRPSIYQLEGRRWEHLHMTWSALDVIAGNGMSHVLASNQARSAPGSGLVTVGWIDPKRTVREIKELKIDSITITEGPNAFGEFIHIVPNPAQE